jgi:hypothetical protein
MYLFERPHLEKYPNCHHPLKALIAPRRQMTRVSSVHPSKTRKVNIQHLAHNYKDLNNQSYVLSASDRAKSYTQVMEV